MFSSKSTLRREYPGLLRDLLGLWVSINSYIIRTKNKVFLNDTGLGDLDSTKEDTQFLFFYFVNLGPNTYNVEWWNYSKPMNLL